MANLVKIVLGPVVKFLASSRVAGFSPHDAPLPVITADAEVDIYYPRDIGPTEGCADLATDDRQFDEPSFTQANQGTRRKSIADLKRLAGSQIAQIAANYTTAPVFDYGLVLDDG